MGDGSRLALDHPRPADQKGREQKRRDAEAENVADSDGDGAVVTAYRLSITPRMLTAFCTYGPFM
jgi:hypothetical protein